MTFTFPFSDPSDHIQSFAVYQERINKGARYAEIRTDDRSLSVIIYSEYSWRGRTGLMIDLALTDPKYRGRGYSAMLFRTIFAENPTRYFSLSVNKENTAAIRLYEKLGFTFEKPSDMKNPKVSIVYMSRKPDHVPEAPKVNIPGARVLVGPGLTQPGLRNEPFLMHPHPGGGN